MDKFLAEIADKIVLMLVVVVGGVALIVQQWMQQRRREMIHRERLAALEKGLELPPDSPPSRGLGSDAYLLRGLLWTFAGLAILICSLGIGLLAPPGRTFAFVWAFCGLIPIAIGLAYLLYCRLRRGD